MHRLSVLLAAVICLQFALPVAAQTWNPGDRCRAHKPVRLSSKPRGKGKKVKVASEALITIVDVGRNGVQVMTETGEGYIKGAQLNKRCTKLTEDPAPEPPPETTPPGSEPETETEAAETAEVAETAETVAPERAETPATREVSAEDIQQAASAAARALAADLTARLGRSPAMVFVAPFRAPEGDGTATAFVDGLATAMVKERGTPVIERGSIKAALEEAALAQAATDSAIAQVAGGMGADVMIAGSVDAVGNSYVAHVRAVGVADATLLAAVKVTFTAGGGAPDSEARSLEAQLRRLGDKLAGGLERMPGDLRYQRVAVLPFEEQGGTTVDRQLGLLVSAELTTVLRRDHGVMLIERAQLGSVLEEMALGQTGLVEPAQAVEVGKLAGAQGLVVGSVSEAGDRYLVNARVVAADSGEVVHADAVPLPAADLVALSSEAVVLRSRTGALYRSLLLPGWGQIYNRQPIKAGIFVGAEVAAIAGAVAFHIRGVDWEGKYDDLGAGAPTAKFARRLDRAETAYMWRNILIYVAVGVHVANVLDALLSGKSYDPASLGPGSGGLGLGGAW